MYVFWFLSVILLQKSSCELQGRFFNTFLSNTIEERGRKLQDKLKQANEKIDHFMLIDNDFDTENDFRKTLRQLLNDKLIQIQRVEASKKKQGLNTRYCTDPELNYLKNYMIAFNTHECNNEVTNNHQRLRDFKKDSLKLHKEIDDLIARARRNCLLAFLYLTEIRQLETKCYDLVQVINVAILQANSNKNVCIVKLKRTLTDDITKRSGNIMNCLIAIKPKPSTTSSTSKKTTTATSKKTTTATSKKTTASSTTLKVTTPAKATTTKATTTPKETTTPKATTIPKATTNSETTTTPKEITTPKATTTPKVTTTSEATTTTEATTTFKSTTFPEAITTTPKVTTIPIDITTTPRSITTTPKKHRLPKYM